jgi:hypothetical protein
LHVFPCVNFCIFLKLFVWSCVLANFGPNC